MSEFYGGKTFTEILEDIERKRQHEDAIYGAGLSKDNSYLYFDRYIDNHISNYVNNSDNMTYSEKLVIYVRHLNWHPGFLSVVKTAYSRYVRFKRTLDE